MQLLGFKGLNRCGW